MADSRNHETLKLKLKYSDQPNHKKKVWTRTKNGLYGWRIIRPVNTYQVESQTENLTEQRPLSARAEKTNELSSKHESNLKTKLSLGGEISGESESFACRRTQKAET